MTPFPKALAELSRTGPVSPDVMGRLACEGTVIPVYVGEGAEVLAMGRKIRIANKARARPCGSETGDASSRAATSPPSTASPTTPHPTPPGRISSTWCSCADSTTG
ncbi:hypothetical protein BH24ACT4_BH24ACT4_15870 [soil metagenome]